MKLRTRPFLYIGGASGTFTPANTSFKYENPEDEFPFGYPLHRNYFGSSTSSFLVGNGEEAAFIDCGTGVVQVSRLVGILENPKITKVYGFFSHYHVDHTLAIQNNALLFRKGLVQTLYGPYLGAKLDFEKLFKRSFETEQWPISPAKMGVSHIFAQFNPGARLDVWKGITTHELPHPEGASAYRFHFEEGDIVIATDAELSTKANRESYAEFVSGTRYLYVDMQYRDKEYNGEVGIGGGPALSRIGWGHSTPTLIAETLSLCKVLPQTVLAGHHDPMRTDQDLAAFEGEVKNQFGPLGIEIIFARENKFYKV